MDNETLKNLISKNVFVSLFSNGFYLVTRLFIPPLTLSMVSLDEYGIWAACFVLVGYLGMGVSGIANTYIRYVGIYHKRGDIDAISRLLSTGLTIATIGMALALILIWFGIPSLIRAFSVPEHLHDTAFHLFFGTVCIFMAELSWGAFSFALVGLQKIVAEKTTRRQQHDVEIRASKPIHPIYADRTPCRYFDHRHSCGNAAASTCPSERKSKTGGLRHSAKATCFRGLRFRVGQ